MQLYSLCINSAITVVISPSIVATFYLRLPLLSNQSTSTVLESIQLITYSPQDHSDSLFNSSNQVIFGAKGCPQTRKVTFPENSVVCKHTMLNRPLLHLYKHCMKFQAKLQIWCLFHPYSLYYLLLNEKKSGPLSIYLSYSKQMKNSRLTKEHLT